MIITKPRILNTLVEAFIYQRSVQTADVYWQMRQHGIIPGVKSKIVRLKPDIKIYR